MAQSVVTREDKQVVPEKVLAGVERLVRDYALARPGDTAVVAYTPDSRTAAAWVILSLQQLGASVHPIHMLPAPMVDEGLPDRLGKALPDPTDLGRLLLITLELNTMSHVDIFRDALLQYRVDQWRAVRIINASEELFTHGLTMTPAEFSAINAGLLHRLADARHLVIKTSSGTHVEITLDPKYRWLSNRGMPRRGGFVILPPGEVSTYPARINGTFVADGALNINAFTRADPLLGDHPLTVKLEDSRLVGYECSDPAIERLVARTLEYEFADRVGELGFGTNILHPGFIRLNSHINERRPGVHIGMGQHNQTLELVPYLCPTHLDLCASDALVWVDDSPEPIDFRNLRPSEVAHSCDVDDEDIDGDCCGVFRE